MLQTNFCSNLLCRELLQVSEYGPRSLTVRNLCKAVDFILAISIFLGDQRPLFMLKGENNR
jgi:hypothetical protein